MFKDIIEADILIIGTPIWLGEKSSMAQKLIDRLCSHSAEMNEKGQGLFSASLKDWQAGSRWNFKKRE